jgi:hypothetical protein
MPASLAASIDADERISRVIDVGGGGQDGRRHRVIGN